MAGGTDGRPRCFGDGDPLYEAYHDTEWGRPVHDDRLLFEMLTLEGAQAGLSWITILRRREGYRGAFHQFDIDKILAMDEAELNGLMENPGIIRNRLKIFSVPRNARIFRSIQEEVGSFDRYLWDQVDGKPIVNRPASLSAMPTRSDLSDRLSRDLKRRGMTFVGSTILHAYLQAVGVYNEHIADCWMA